MTVMTDSMLEFRMKLLHESNRRATFKNWIFSDNSKCNASKLAEAGFYYSGSKDEPDAVCCFICEKSLDGWEEDDDPWKEHVSHSKGCMFAKMQTAEHNLTLLQLATLKEELVVMLFNKMYDEIRGDIKNYFADAKLAISQIYKARQSRH